MSNYIRIVLERDTDQTPLDALDALADIKGLTVVSIEQTDAVALKDAAANLVAGSVEQAPFDSSISIVNTHDLQELKRHV